MGQKTKKQIERDAKRRAKKQWRQENPGEESRYAQKRRGEFRFNAMSNRIKSDENGYPVIPARWNDTRHPLDSPVFIVQPTPFTPCRSKDR